MPSGIYRKVSKPSGHGLDKFLGKLEIAVMEILWQSSPLTVRQVHDRVSRERHLAYTTIMTVMLRLAGKGVLRRAKQGRAFIYRPARSREELRADLAAGVSRALLADFGEVAVAQFVKQLASIDPSALSRLGDLARADEDETDG
jgi:predicted transcriptional regulator